MFRTFIAAILALCTAFAAQAQDQNRAILILDASGSMWGQIDGVAKITIAQDVIGELLQSLPDSTVLGLAAYGHRRKGDCSDIEVLMQPGAARADILAAVKAIKPKGKTPMTDAVIAAAQALKYTEEAATVILVSDGIETCNPDPCAAARVLEETGVNFTAHVVGFNISDPEAIAQMRCLAEETGGTFRTADTAEELSAALAVVAEPEPEPEPVSVTFRATEGDAEVAVSDGLVWTLGQDAAGTIYEDESAAMLQLDMLPGTGMVSVTRTADGARAETRFTVGDSDLTVTLNLPLAMPAAMVEAPASAPAGSLVPVTWTGPDDENDYVATAQPEMTGGSIWIDYSYLRDGDGQTAMLRMPPEPGIYEIRYIWSSQGNKVLARATIEVTPLDIGFDAPDTAVVGSTTPVGWIGPDYEGDYIASARPDQDDTNWTSYEYTAAGNPLSLVMPAEPGTYELRYVLGASRYVAGRTTIEVTDVAATLSAASEAVAGAPLSVVWTGPDYESDYIAIARAGDPGHAYETYTYTRDGSPLTVAVPLEPGDYELRYVMNQDRRVLARAALTVTEIGATLNAPDTAPAGSEITVVWTGPDYQNDYVDIAEEGAAPHKYVTYEYTRNGSPLKLALPTEPGDYVVRYIATGNERQVLASRALKIEPVGALLDAPVSVVAGATLQVGWTGPGYQNDYIDIAEPGAAPHKYVTYEYTRDGSPLALTAPTEPGEYVLRYILTGNERQVLASRTLMVEPVTATLNAAATAPAGSKLTVVWTGPGYQNDYIDIAEPGAAPHKYIAYDYTRNGSPLTVQVPTEPGEYVLRYILTGTERQVLVSQPLTVEAVSASLTADAHAPAGSELVVDWTGPAAQNDYIAVARPGEPPQKYESYTYTRDGSPLRVQVPTEPGDYELRYVATGTDRAVLTSVPLTSDPVAATLDTAPSAGQGSEVVVNWQGPGYRNDYIAIARPGEVANKYETYSYTRNGSPLRVQVPGTPGDYELRYVVTGTDRTVLAAVPFSVTPETAALDADASAPAGGQIVVTWQGPGNNRDYIAIARADDPDGYESYSYARDGSPLRVKVPEAPGAYELRYVLGEGRTIIARRALTVE